MTSKDSINWSVQRKLDGLYLISAKSRKPLTVSSGKELGNIIKAVPSKSSNIHVKVSDTCLIITINYCLSFKFLIETFIF